MPCLFVRERGLLQVVPLVDNLTSSKIEKPLKDGPKEEFGPPLRDCTDNHIITWNFLYKGYRVRYFENIKRVKQTWLGRSWKLVAANARRVQGNAPSSDSKTRKAVSSRTLASSLVVCVIDPCIELLVEVTPCIEDSLPLPITFTSPSPSGSASTNIEFSSSCASCSLAFSSSSLLGGRTRICNAATGMTMDFEWSADFLNNLDR